MCFVCLFFKNGKWINTLFCLFRLRRPEWNENEGQFIYIKTNLNLKYASQERTYKTIFRIVNNRNFDEKKFINFYFFSFLRQRTLLEWIRLNQSLNTSIFGFLLRRIEIAVRKLEKLKRCLICYSFKSNEWVFRNALLIWFYTE